MVTIKDLSQKTGYSIATVSKALNYTGRIPEETRNIILAAADEMGYIPNHSARLLKTTKSWTIGVIYEGNSNLGLYHPFYSRVLEFFRKEVEANGYDLLFLSQSFGTNKLSYLEHAMMKGVDGILVLCGPMYDSQFTDVFHSTLPSVVIDYISEHTTTTITSQSKTSFYEVVQTLKEYGHQSIAYVHGPTSSYIGGCRMNNFINAMDDHNLPIDENLLIWSDYYTRDAGVQAAKRLLSLPKQPTAILCSSDDVALGVIDELKQQDITIPGDISVIGFDGIRDERYGDYYLGYIKQDLPALGETAAKEILNQISTKVKQEQKAIYIPTTFIKNDTVGPCKKE